MEQLHLKAPKLDINTVMVDFKAKVGKEQGYTRNVEKYKLHQEKNDKGRRLIEFALARSVVVSSITLQH